MRCYLIRHGKDCDTVRGGWSQHPLTEEGVKQAEMLADQIALNRDLFSIKSIYSSDLPRAMQTAQILSDRMHLPVIPAPQFRETNNGELAGMRNDLALVRYPGLFWNQLEWDQCYPNGESPKHFCQRISNGWNAFSRDILLSNENVALVTHGGVIHVILSIVHGEQYSNRKPQRKIPYTGIVALEYLDGRWEEIY